MPKQQVSVNSLVEKINSIRNQSEARMNKASDQAQYAFERGIMTGMDALKMWLGVN